MHTPHAHRDVYLCEGTCRTVVSLQEFTDGATTCAAPECSHFGRPRTRRVQCDRCGKVRTPTEYAAHHPTPTTV